MKIVIVSFLIFFLTISLSAFADTTYVAAGNVSGIWTADNSPYVLLEGDIIVPEDECLIIEPGVEVLIDDSLMILVEGCMQAVGAEGDSIRFANYEQYHHWKHIKFYYAANSLTASSRLLHSIGLISYMVKAFKTKFEVL